ncbi:MAG: MurR/RpiR family transcriptional regulator [Alphaproteobacteria bacterium]|nr:MurR/RpiR family transcriptional regulator [Alphaproteobacteria bacterium]
MILLMVTDLMTPAPTDFEALKRLVVDRRDSLPARLRQCAEYALREPDRMALGTVSELAEAAGVQPSALVRFAQAIGFSGFTELQKVFRTRLTNRRPDYSDRLNRLGSRSAPDLLAGFMDSAHASLDTLRHDLDGVALDQAVDILVQAKSIHIMGLRRAFPVASYLFYMFGKLEIPAKLVDGIGGILEGQAQTLLPGDALLIATFAPYSPEVIDFASLVYGRGMPVVAITDTALSPAARIASAVLEVKEAELGAFRSLSATMCLAMTLAVAVGEGRRDLDR